MEKFSPQMVLDQLREMLNLNTAPQNISFKIHVNRLTINRNDTLSLEYTLVYIELELFWYFIILASNFRQSHRTLSPTI